VKAIASGNPLVIEKAQVDAELIRLTRLRSAHAEEQYRIRSSLRHSHQEVQTWTERLGNLREDLTLQQDTGGDQFRIELDKQLHGNRAACVGMEEAAAIFGWPNYYLPFLVRAGHLKPLGKPAQNARKWFATVEIERMSCDPDWLDKAIRIVEKQIQEMNKKQRGKEQPLMSLV
jgi:hypothetical protein